MEKTARWDVICVWSRASPRRSAITFSPFSPASRCFLLLLLPNRVAPAPVTAFATCRSRLQLEGRTSVLHGECQLQDLSMSAAKGPARGLCPSRNPVNVCRINERCPDLLPWSGYDEVSDVNAFPMVVTEMSIYCVEPRVKVSALSNRHLKR